MHIENIYTDPLLKYPLSSDENSEIDKVWDFLDIFTKPYIYLTDYRNHLITTIITKPLEGSSDIFCKNDFNLYTSTILFDRDLYETIMHDPENKSIMNIRIPQFYYQQDYGFPNLNFMVYSFGDKEDWINRINK